MLVLLWIYIWPTGAMEWKEEKLFATVKSNNIFATKLLLLAGACVSTKDAAGCTPLHYAAMLRTPKMIDLLIKHGALVTEADKNAFKPLHYAAYSCRVANIESLYNCEVRPLGQREAEGSYKETLLHLAVGSKQAVPIQQRECTVSWLMQRNRPQDDEAGRRALKLAIRRCRPSIIKQLVPLGMFCNTPVDDIVHAMRHHTTNEQQLCLTAFIQNALNNHNSVDREHCFLIATQMGFAESAITLLQDGLSIKTQKKAWEIIVQQENMDLAVIMPTTSINLNMPNHRRDGTIPLAFFAAQEQFFKVLPVLRAYGADPHEQISVGTILHVAAKYSWRNEIPNRYNYLLFPLYPHQFHQKHAKSIVAFLLCKQRLRSKLPKNIVYKIISHLPPYSIFSATLLRFCLPHVTENNWHDYINFCDTRLLQDVARRFPRCLRATELLVQQEQRAQALCSIPNVEGKLAHELTTRRINHAYYLKPDTPRLFTK